ncbi:MAG: hypothetical protein AAF282_24175, partial [Cyanobacteria bacterium P01_A01_bin.15]
IGRHLGRGLTKILNTVTECRSGVSSYRHGLWTPELKIVNTLAAAGGLWATLGNKYLNHSLISIVNWLIIDKTSYDDRELMQMNRRGYSMAVLDKTLG